MPSKRDVLAHLTRDELNAAADQFELTVADRRVKDQLVDAVGSSKRAGLAGVLPSVSRDRPKELCRALGLEASRKERATLPLHHDERSRPGDRSEHPWSAGSRATP